MTPEIHQHAVNVLTRSAGLKMVRSGARTSCFCSRCRLRFSTQTSGSFTQYRMYTHTMATSERIRDKIGASKRKGLWVGGMVPLGYLFIEEEEAERVRTIFRRYL